MAPSRIGNSVKPWYCNDWPGFLTFNEKLDPTVTVAIIDQPDHDSRIRELRARCPKTTVVARFIPINPSDKQPLDGSFHLQAANGDKWVVSPENFLNAWGHLGEDGQTLYALNEPDTYGTPESLARLVDWMLETLRLADQRGISLTIGNFGVGHPRLTTDGEEWFGAFDPVLKALSAAQGRHYLGLHEYGPYSTWRVGRLNKMVKRCQVLRIAPPDTFVTEYGLDTEYPGDVLDGYKSRGYNGETFARWQVAHLQNVYQTHIRAGWLKGLATFIWCNEKRWENFNTEVDKGWQGEMLDLKRRGLLSVDALVNPSPSPSPVPGEGDKPTPVPVPEEKPLTVEAIYREIAATHRKLAELYERMAGLALPVRV